MFALGSSVLQGASDLVNAALECIRPGQVPAPPAELDEPPAELHEADQTQSHSSPARTREERIQMLICALREVKKEMMMEHGQELGWEEEQEQASTSVYPRTAGRERLNAPADLYLRPRVPGTAPPAGAEEDKALVMKGMGAVRFRGEENEGLGLIEHDGMQHHLPFEIVQPFPILWPARKAPLYLQEGTGSSPKVRRILRKFSLYTASAIRWTFSAVYRVGKAIEGAFSWLMNRISRV